MMEERTQMKNCPRSQQSNRRAIKCNVAEWRVVERLIAVPVHGKHRGVTLRGIQ